MTSGSFNAEQGWVTSPEPGAVRKLVGAPGLAALVEKEWTCLRPSCDGLLAVALEDPTVGVDDDRGRLGREGVHEQRGPAVT